MPLLVDILASGVYINLLLVLTIIICGTYHSTEPVTIIVLKAPILFHEGGNMRLINESSRNVLMVIALLLASMIGCSPSEQIDETDAAAVVNSTVIPKADVQRSLDAFTSQYKMMGTEIDSATTDSLSGKILESMINAELLYQKSQEAGFAVSDEEVADEFDAMTSRYPSKEQFLETIAKQGITEEILKKQMAQNLSIKKYVDEKIVNEIVIPDEDKTKYYEEHKDDFTHDEQVAARHIVVRAGEGDAADSLARKKAMLEGLHERLVAGEDFAAMAVEYSEGPSASKGGDIGYITRGQVVEPFAETAFSLDVNEISKVIQTSFGFHIIQVYDKRPAGTPSFEEVEDGIEETLRRPLISEHIDSLVQELRAAADIKILP